MSRTNSVEFWQSLALSTAPLDRGAVEDSITAIYTHCGLKKPLFKYYPSPIAATTDYLRLLKSEPVSLQARRLSPEALIRFIYDGRARPVDDAEYLPATELAGTVGRLYGSIISAYYPALRPRTIVGGCWAIARCMQKGDRATRRMLLKAAEHCNVWFPYTDIVQVCERPTQVTVDERFLLHNQTAPAITWADGEELYFWHGVNVPGQIVLGTVTVDAINRERNQEFKRIMLEIYGTERYISEQEPISVDKYGKLFRFNNQTAVRVLNSTPEPDGTTKVYVLKTTPFARTPKEAIASTFGMDSRTYNPKIET